MNKILSKVEAGVVALLTFGAPLAVLGQTLPNPNIVSPDAVFDKLCVIAGWAFTFLIVLAIIFVLAAAFRYLTAQGDPEKVSGANQALIYAAVAVAVGVLARAVPLVVSGFLGAGGIRSCP